MSKIDDVRDRLRKSAPPPIVAVVQPEIGEVPFVKMEVDISKKTYKKTDLGDMVALTDKRWEPIFDDDGVLVDGVLRFGKKHNGLAMSEIARIDRSYLRWIASTDGFNEAMKSIARKWVRA